MNNNFDLKRFGQVVAEDWKLYLRRFGVTLIVWASLPVLIWITSLVFEVEIDPGARAGFIAAFIIATVMTVPANMYGKANLSRDGVSFAMLPATSSEKFLSMVLYCSIVTPLFCGLGAWAVDSLLTLLPLVVSRNLSSLSKWITFSIIFFLRPCFSSLNQPSSCWAT